jgi:uncharacterized membrane protein
MATIREEVDIEAPAVRVWEVVHEELDRAPKWSSYLTQAELIGGGTIGRGSRIRYQLDLPGGIREQLELEVTSCSKPKKCAGKFAKGPLKGDWSYTYREKEGSTHLVYEMDYELGGLLRFAAGLLSRQYAEGIRTTMANLKKYVEAGTRKPTAKPAAKPTARR